MRLFVLVALALVAPTVLAQCSTTNFCTCVGNAACQACVVGSSVTCGAIGNSTCTGTAYSGTSAANMCTDFLNCGTATSVCNCIKLPNCGFCNGASGAPGTCVGGVTGAALASTCPAASWFPKGNPTVENQCKLEKAQIVAKVAVGVGVPVLFIIYVIVWWCVRGRWWWHSTGHKRCCWAEGACCGWGPKEANPPPHGKSKGPKSTATRVAPCWTANPCAWCDNLDGWIDKKTGKAVGDHYRPLHKCGLGFACACAWMPGMCCFKWSDKCLQTCCEDVQDGPIGSQPPAGKGAAAAAPAAGAEPKKGKFADKLKKKKNRA
eukprot:a678474_44.p2 GENE.a678474_44~~a678474_44.p2  ORF type:complete len:328 (+),score=76.14 a678474_44:27-986(+)